MTTTPRSQTRTRPQPLPWTIILGLGATSLLWPLTALVGLPLEGLTRPLVILVVTAATWIAVGGFGRIARPVLSLTLAGVVYGIVMVTVGALVPGAGGPSGLVPTLAALVIGTARATGIGALCGLAAAGVQRVTGRPYTDGVRR